MSLPAPFVRRIFSTTLLVLSGCGLPGRDTAPQDSAPADPWTDEISARIRDAAHAFVADGDTFTAESPGHGISGRFDGAGALLQREDEGIAVRSTRWGRANAMERISAAPPQLGACVAGREDPEGNCIPRLEYADAGLTEWWTATEDGFEQGWTLDAPPAGAGAVAIDVGVDGATVTVGDGEVWLHGDGGELWIVSGLVAWDADGTPLDARFELAEGGLRVTVDDAGARYPIEIDPVYSTASTTMTGSAGSSFGWSVSGAGDVNGDGYDDVIVGAYVHGSGAGQAYVYLGSAEGISTTASTTLTGEATRNYFGFSVSGAGDVNGDGYDDVIVGASGYSSDLGRAYVFEGSATGVASGSATTADATLTGEARPNSFGISVSGAGDVNGDGYDDVIVGADYYSSSTGRAYVFEGSATGVATGIATTADTALTGGAMFDNFAYSVSGAGDVDGDGYDDVIVGAYQYSLGTGRAYVFQGSATGVASRSTTTADTTLTGEARSYYFGRTVSGAGDVNGDGYDDVIVGEPFHGSGAGRASVFAGSATGVATALSTAASTTLTGETASDNFGLSVSGAGDVNGDGYDDVIVGAYYHNSGTGRAYVFGGSGTGLATTADTTLNGVDAYAYFGCSVSGAGDVNGDGYDDVIVGAWAHSSGTGRVYVHHGYEDADGDGYVATNDCDDTDASVTVESTFYADADGDSYGSAATSVSACEAPTGYVVDTTDCDDAVAAINPAATEVCDAANTDEDCDGLADDFSAAGLSTFYTDLDSDGYGSATTGSYCDMPPGYVTESGDCDDTNPAISPSATEVCDAANTDENCDGLADDASATGRSTFYADADGDGYGSDTTGLYCDVPSGYVADTTDCDDSVGTINPSATEVCDPANTDEDCDGLADDASATGRSTFYADVDGDGYGSDTAGPYCDLPAGYVADTTDCDDSSAAISPAATEVCDASNTDEDCDSLADNADPSATGESTFYADVDGDGYAGDTTGLYCDLPSGWFVATTDCDDSSAAISPGATEVCDAANTDEDCDGLADDASAAGRTTFYADVDGDGYGGETTALYCDVPSGYVADTTDCDDSNSAISPSSTEICDAANTDEDCDGLADDADPSATGESTFYADLDGDGYAGDTTGLYCDLPSGYFVDPTDCDDTSATVNPAATEVFGDEIDQDCDTTESCYVDADLDGARTAFVVASPDVACTAPGEALATADLDCDDTDATAYPAAAELTGSGVDEDCDGSELCYTDGDDDAYRPDETATTASDDGDCDDAGEALASALIGDCDDASAAYNPAAVESDCADPADYNCDGSVAFADTDGDAFAACEECDDADASVYPGAIEIAGDGIDGDCDGVDLCYVDADGDGYRGDDTTVTGTTVACDGDGEASDLDPVGDCDDTDVTVNPAASETIGDALDADCDGTETCYVDADGDGYRSEDGATVVSSTLDCADAGAALASAGVDCDDTNDTVSPSATELAGDEVDSDCDTTELCFVDADADGYRPDATSTIASADVTCANAGEALASTPTTDCDDTDAAVNPDGLELVGDALDSDCDGAELCYADVDDDGYVDGTGTTIASTDTDCADANEALTTSSAGDCNDADAAYNPGVTESDCADPNDYNCDGSVGYDDADADGYAACAECDDGDATVNPAATELAGDGVDQDCDSTETCYVDADDDGFRPDATSTIESTNLVCDGAGEAVASDLTTDCDDTNVAVNAAATELAGDEVDQDCDATELCYVDADADGYTADGGAIVASDDLLCDGAGEALAGAPAGDCDDASVVFNPGAPEDDCTDPTDYNCDGSSGFVDGDSDGFAACEECDDAVGAVNPDAGEVCDGADNDCDGTIDINAIDAVTWYADADGDGYTDAGEVTTACNAPEGYAAATEADCDDADATSFPGGDELPDDGIDQDCDGEDAIAEDTDTDTDVPDDDTGDGIVDEKDGGDCGCASTSTNGTGLAWSAALVALLAVRRRRAV